MAAAGTKLSTAKPKNNDESVSSSPQTPASLKRKAVPDKEISASEKETKTSADVIQNKKAKNQKPAAGSKPPTTQTGKSHSQSKKVTNTLKSLISESSSAAVKINSPTNKPKGRGKSKV